MINQGKYLLAIMLLIGTLSHLGCKGTGIDTAPSATESIDTVQTTGSIDTAPTATGIIVSRHAVLSGNEEAPPVATGASGSGLLKVDMTTGRVSGSVKIWTAPTSTIISSHVQEGVRGENGCIVVSLENAGGCVWNVPAGITLSPSYVNAFAAGKLYFNVRTNTSPLGELRGQIDAGQ